MKKLVALFILVFCIFTNLHAQINNNPESLRDVPLNIYLQIGFLFVYIVLGVLFLSLFIFYPRQRLNLFFSLYNISVAYMILSIQFFKTLPNDPVQSFFSRLAGMNILLFILFALDRMKPFFWWYIGYILCIDFPLNILFPKQYFVFNEIGHILFSLICLSLAFRAFRNKKPGDWLIGFVALAVVFNNMKFILFEAGNIPVGLGAIAAIPQFITTISVVIYLALRYGRANTSLEHQLKQVRILSEANLKTEKEKHEILEAQNETLEKQVAERTGALSKSLNDLKSAQTQLIQSEKMASLGELTAGIAHEIQNPLNFVNNFSEVNTELIDEAGQEINSGNIDKVKSLLINIKDNEQKINHHGKRADSIVKGMLQHSRSSTGAKEPTDINALVDEYLRLSYFGLRAKDNLLNVTLKTDLDKSIGKINIIPQDIGRVLLNIYTNAFYAIAEKKKLIKEGYEPTVSVITKKALNQVSIIVNDNGYGIHKKVIDKIFQPFFTTKPTGQGTGLGLSLSYDIIKAHGGEIKLDTKEGEFTEFIITLPS